MVLWVLFGLLLNDAKKALRREIPAFGNRVMINALYDLLRRAGIESTTP
jgi:hypothetical protein